MRTDEDRAKHAGYMREYNAKNKDRINQQRRDNLKMDKIENPEKYKQLRKRSNHANKKYHDEHRDEVNARAKARNWNYDVDRAKVKRAKHYRKHPATNVLRPRKSFAKKHNLPFELTSEWYEEQFELGCQVTGLPFDENGSDTPWVPHIDRIIPKKGYTITNCRLVCGCYNLAKKHWTDDDVMRMAKSLVEYNV